MRDGQPSYTDLIRALIEPEKWDWLLEHHWQVVRPEHREECLAAGIKRFDELFVAGKSPQIAKEGAREAIQIKARALEKKYQKSLDRMAPKIQAKIDELIQGKEDSFQLGYEVAEALKAEGYTWEQVKHADKYRGGLSAGLQIKYTGYYD